MGFSNSCCQVIWLGSILTFLSPLLNLNIKAKIGALINIVKFKGGVHIFVSFVARYVLFYHAFSARIGIRIFSKNFKNHWKFVVSKSFALRFLCCMKISFTFFGFYFFKIVVTCLYCEWNSDVKEPLFIAFLKIQSCHNLSLSLCDIFWLDTSLSSWSPDTHWHLSLSFIEISHLIYHS